MVCCMDREASADPSSSHKAGLARDDRLKKETTAGHGVPCPYTETAEATTSAPFAQPAKNAAPGKTTSTANAGHGVPSPTHSGQGRTPKKQKEKSEVRFVLRELCGAGGPEGNELGSPHP